MIHDAALRALIDQVRDATSEGRQLDIRGGDTKAFLGGPRRGEPLLVRNLVGISSYEPTELVVTARAGTLLSDLEATLADAGQYLPFEPPRLAPGGTVGGMVAAGLAGPARATVGSLRDYVLGMTLLTGRGKVVTFGGQVMKNVAGYDVARLLAGSMGVLGVILEVSIKVLPRPKAMRSLVLEVDEANALALIDGWRRLPLPINATAWHEGRLLVRLAGAHAAVESAAKALGGHQLGQDDDQDRWTKLRDQRHRFFGPAPGQPTDAGALWRLSLPAGVAPLGIEADTLIEWGGCQRWLRTPADAACMHAVARRVGGHATRWSATGPASDRFGPMVANLLQLHRLIKRAFDPQGIFNPGRLHPEF